MAMFHVKRKESMKCVQVYKATHNKDIWQEINKHIDMNRITKEINKKQNIWICTRASNDK